MNLESVVRDAFEAEADQSFAPDEQDLLARFARHDRIVRRRRVAAGGTCFAAVAVAALVISGLAPGGARRVDVANRGGTARHGAVVTTQRPAAGVSTTIPTTTPTTRRIPVGDNGTGVHAPGNAGVVVVPSQPETPVTSPAVTPTTVHQSTPTTVGPTPTTVAPLTWTMNPVPSSGSTSIWFQGTGPPGATITTNTPYLETAMNDGTFPVYYNGAWGGYAGFKMEVGQTIDITMTCTCGGSRTIRYTRTS